MKKLIHLLVILNLYIPFNLSGQTPIHEKNLIELINETPQEKIFLHYNSPLLFSGENLYYKVYSINFNTGGLSQLSKIAYVALVGGNKEVVFKHKIALENGLGYGDFFIPTSVPSGNYKLIGTTNWMKNGADQNFFMADIAIINPYSPDLAEILYESEEMSKNESNPIESGEDQIVKQRDKNEKNYLSIELPKGKTYSTREKVLLKLKGLKGFSSHGNYSISVRKIDSIAPCKTFTSENFTSLYPNEETQNTTQGSVYLPDLMGDLIKGKILLKDESDNLPLENVKVALSVPGEEFVLNISSTNEKGIFYFNLDEKYFGNTAAIQILGGNKNKYTLKVLENPIINYSALDFEKLHISSQAKENILKRSIYNQIQNAYLMVKPDSIKTYSKEEPFYGNSFVKYNLDDYDRFPTIDLTFTEIIKAAAILHKNGEPYIYVRGLNPSTEINAPPLILVDGLLIQDQNDLIEYNANEIQSILISRKKYYYGPKVYQGLVVVETKKGDFYENYAKSYIENIEIKSPEPEKDYFHQTYDNTKSKFARIPDFRTQLLWLPEVQLNSEAETINFFTSDVSGKYRISLEGFTVNGEPVSLRKIIKVE